MAKKDNKKSKPQVKGFGMEIPKKPVKPKEDNGSNDKKK